MAEKSATAYERDPGESSPDFNRMAHRYDDSRGEYPTELMLKGLKLALGDAFASIDGARVLDAGAGTGQISVALLSAGATVTGIDLSASMLEIAKTRCSDFAKYTTVVGDLTSLPFDDGSFDFVVSRWVMEFIPDWPRAVREMRRVLKPDGALVLIFTHNMLDTVMRKEFEKIARKRGAPVGVPGATGRMLKAYLKQQGAEIADLVPKELHWERELPLEQTRRDFRARMTTRLFRISDDEYEEILEETEGIIAGSHPNDHVDRPVVVTQLWRVKFSRRPSTARGLYFEGLYILSRAKRRLPRYLRRSVFKARSVFGQ